MDLNKKDVMQSLIMSTVIVTVCVFAFNIPIRAVEPVEKTIDLTQLLVMRVAQDKEYLALIRQNEIAVKREATEKERRSNSVVALKPWETRSF